MKQPLTLKDHLQETSLFSQRVVILLGIIVLLTLVLLMRLMYLQVIERERYTTLSQQNLLNVLPIDPNRGLIYDRNGVLIAENIPVFSLELIPRQVKNLEQTLTQLQTLMDLSNDELQNFRQLLKKHRRSEAIPIRIKLSEEEVARFYVNQYRFPGVSVQARLIRHYPLGQALAHAVGYVGRLNGQELNLVDSINYMASNYIGKTGIEHTYENQLHGQVGYEQVEIDAAGRIIRTLNYHAPTAGDDLYLTLDSRLNLAAEEAMGNYRGAVVAIEPKTGQILALVSTPSYTPNPLVTGLQQRDFLRLQQVSDQPMYNRAIAGQYPPGSTIKPFIGLGSLVLNLNEATRTIYDPGWFKLPDSTHIYHDFHPEGHGRINLSRAIIASCDTYFYDLATKLGIHNIEDMLHHFGFGERTGLNLKGERAGILPSPEWKLAHNGKSWYPGDTVITGIGQGYMLATPLQLAVATATIANHCTWVQPTLLLKRQPAYGTAFAPAVIQHTTLSCDETSWQTVVAAMRGVIENPEGTGRRFGNDASYSAAGKTGTSQVFSKRTANEVLPEKLRDHSLFIAFAPIDNPQIAVAVVVENAPHAAPVVARKVLDAYLQGKPPHA